MEKVNTVKPATKFNTIHKGLSSVNPAAECVTCGGDLLIKIPRAHDEHSWCDSCVVEKLTMDVKESRPLEEIRK